MKCIVTELSDEEINAAADFIISERGEDTNEELYNAYGKIAVFRETFSYALRAVSAVLRKRALAVDSNAVVYGRPKRMSSLLLKLMRIKTLKATNMQDVGGCRAVLENVETVQLLAEDFRNVVAKGAKENDYIRQPKTDGYRSIHFVVHFVPKNPNYRNVPGRKIEIQLRSRLQHQWATAVETVDLFTGQNLKSGRGNPDWKRFFLLSSNLFSLKEECPTVAGCPADKDETISEVSKLWTDLRMFDRLNQWATVIHDIIPQEHGTNAMYLIETDIDEKTTTVKVYPAERMKDAYADYFKAEFGLDIMSSRKAVLVSAYSVDELRQAFPSYYGDTASFINEIELEIDR